MQTYLKHSLFDKLTLNPDGLYLQTFAAWLITAGIVWAGFHIARASAADVLMKLYELFILKHVTG